MPSNYLAITEYNEHQLGQDTSSRKTQISMYSDPTHFVYEILQNADDYGATEVFFKLSKNELQIEHNGKPFLEENVKAITYFGQSTSRDDLVRTGRFGVGFKSVFSFTATPIIISGSEHFQIYGLYRVKEHPYPDRFPHSRTRIILPFNHEAKQPDYVEDLMPREEAYAKISTRLTTLNMNTLLFTRNVREIRWEIGGRSGHYLREDDTNGNARRTTITDGEQLKKYLVFSRVPQWENQEYKAVEIVFGIDEKGQIILAKDFLYVLFATTQETHLRFILNGPYRTNPARETISEDDPFNVHLVKETCELMKEVLPQLRERNLLTTQFLSVLPNRNNDELKDFYAPLFETIVETFHDQELVPTDDDQYASAANVFRGPTPIREVITKEELPFFVDRPGVCWAKGVQQNSRADNFLRGLSIPSWDWGQLQKALEDKYGWSWPRNDNDDKGLAACSDTWLQKLYLLLAEAIRKDECSEGTLQNCYIIRVLESRRQNHLPGSKAYFPERGYGDLPHVKPAILQGKNRQAEQKIHDSLVVLGVSEIGEGEQIDKLLNTYYSDDGCKVETNQHLEHIHTFIKWRREGNDASKFKDYAIFRFEGKNDLHKPIECFLDLPFEDTGLEALFGCSGIEIPSEKRRYPVSKKYKDVNGFVDFAKSVDVMYQLEIGEYRATKMQKNIFPVIGRRTNKTVDRDYYLNALERSWYNKKSEFYIGTLNLTTEKTELSLAVWKTLCRAEKKVLSAYYYPNDNHSDKEKESSSFLVNQLKSCAWIPDKNGCFQLPADVTEESLHAGFPFGNRNGWLDAIGFGENAKKQSEEYKKREEQASSIGISLEAADRLKKLPKEEREEALKNFEDSITAAHKRTQHIQQESIPYPYHKALPEAFSKPGKERSNDNEGNGGFSQNPSRRREKAQEDIAVAIENEDKLGKRFSFALRKKWKGKNDRIRVDFVEWYDGKCQICEKTFIQRNGEPYFEGLYLVPHTSAEWIDRVGNVLCLCAEHSAKFQYGSKEVDDDIIQQVMPLKVEAEGGDGHPAIRMKLCEDRIEIKFAEKHLIDLQEMIKTAQESGV